MTNEEIEKILFDALKQIDISSYDIVTSKSVSNSEFFYDDKTQCLNLYFRKTNGEACMQFIYKPLADNITFRSIYIDDYDEGEDQDEISISQMIPRTEEQYFQYDLIQDNFFSLEFYQYLEKVIFELSSKFHR